MDRKCPSLYEPGDPAIGSVAQFTFEYTDSVTGIHAIAYRIYHYGDYAVGPVSYDTYVVGTAFIPGRLNCPGS